LAPQPWQDSHMLKTFCFFSLQIRKPGEVKGKMVVCGMLSGNRTPSIYFSYF
jgi:hypothetical protein